MYHRIFGFLFFGLVSALPVTGGVAHAAANGSIATSHYLTAIERAGNRLIAVGERGVILLSDDNGATWRRVESGMDVTLTGLWSVDLQQIWAVGHEGTLLRSEDAGEHWTPVLQRSAVANLTLDEARRLKASPVSADAQALVDALERNAERMHETDSSEPLFSVMFTDPQHGFAVGAYGVVLQTNDAGRTWNAWLGHVENPRNLHLYAITQVNGVIYVAGEQGFLAKSTDQGEHFAKVDTGFSGSFFTLSSDANGAIYAGGLEGVAIRSADQGMTWQALSGAPKQSWVASRKGPDGTLIFANANGGLFQIQQATTFTALAYPKSGALSDFTYSSKGAVIAVGPAGTTHPLISVSDTAVLEAHP